MTPVAPPEQVQKRKAPIFGRRRIRNLVLVVPRRKSLRGLKADFDRIAEHVRATAPDLRAYVIHDHRSAAMKAGLLLRPCFYFSTVATQKIRIPRGALYTGALMTKSEEYRALERANIPVPRWALLTEHHAPDLTPLGEYVVVKPDCGGRGAEVRIRRASRVRWKAPVNERARTENRSGLIAQQFVYTGKWPVSYRVTTLFGKVLFAFRIEADRGRRPLPGPDRFAGGDDGGGLSICSSGRGCRVEMCHDREIIAFGEQAHRAFPDHPLLGIDVVREEATGKLYVIEVNSCGQVWHFSSELGRGIQQDFHLDFESQFDGIRKAADILIEQTRTLAR
jgi:hypothetical protein